MPAPQVGDILIRPGAAAADTFILVDVVTGKYVGGPFRGLALAVGAAKSKAPRAIWHQNVDERGRPMGEPFKLPHD
jgi:hypothetical protein